MPGILKSLLSHGIQKSIRAGVSVSSLGLPRRGTVSLFPCFYIPLQGRFRNPQGFCYFLYRLTLSMLTRLLFGSVSPSFGILAPCSVAKAMQFRMWFNCSNVSSAMANFPQVSSNFTSICFQFLDCRLNPRASALVAGVLLCVQSRTIMRTMQLVCKYMELACLFCDFAIA